MSKLASMDDWFVDAAARADSLRPGVTGQKGLLKGGYPGDYLGDYYKVIKGDAKEFRL